MGGSTSKDETPGLDARVSAAASRLGKIAVTGRFHKTKKITDDYILGSDVLGSGYNGSVYKASAKEGGSSFAVKDFKLRNTDASKMKELEDECEIFLSMDHPHVARLVDVYQSSEKLSLVMECMEGGELFDRVLARKHYSEKETADTTYQMLLALNYLHSHGMVHRDIKLENFLYESQESDHLKLIDFGFSKIYDDSTRMKMSCGTLAYVAPEVLCKSYTEKCDMWSLGVVVFILLTGYMPFSGPEKAQMRDIKAGKYLVKPAWNSVSESARAFVDKLILVDPNQRLSAEDALKHEFITGRSERSQTAEAAEVSTEVMDSLRGYAEASKFRRACMNCMAWSMTNEERKELREAFLAMDKDRTGAITIKEFKACILERYDLDDATVSEIFSKMDASNNHEIQYSEFLAAMVASRVNIHDDLLKATFRRFDTDSTNFIEVSDLKKILGDTFEGEEVENLMKEADTNGDGKISYAEFIEYAKSDISSDNHIEIGHKLVDQELKRASDNDSSSSMLGVFKRKFNM